MVPVKLLTLTVFLCGSYIHVTGDTCQPTASRSDCGYLGITEQECESKECCWQETNNEPWCFYKKSSPAGQCDPDASRRDCGYVGIDQQQCEGKGCCWQPKDDNPWCFYPPSSSSVYVVSNIKTTSTGVELTLKTNGSNQTSAYGTNISPLTVELTEETNDRLHIKIYDPSNKRWEIPSSVSPIPEAPSQAAASPQYIYSLPKVGEEFKFAILRASTKETLFNTSSVELQFADQYLQIGTNLPSGNNIYGIGEHVAALKLPTGTWTLWNFDTATPPKLNLYGSHPFYLDLRTSGSAHGVYLRNSNGMDVVYSSNSLQYLVIGGILDFYFFLGPEPEAVIQQYQEVIGRPHMPPYWGLGFHQCRYGYPSVQALEYVVANYSLNNIPLDTMWTDIDYMDQYKDFTLDPNNFPSNRMNQFVDKLHSNGQHYVVIVDPGIKTENGYQPYDDGVSEDIFIKDKNGNIFTGKVWPGITAFPDFLNPKASSYWKDQVSTFHQLLPVDGLWIDMDEISNFCYGECTSSYTKWPRKFATQKLLKKRNVKFSPDDPPYAIHNQGSQNTALNTKTLDMDAQHYGGVLEYNAHNLYGLTEAIATNSALMSVRGKRSFVISRSTFPGAGMQTGHWTGDNHSQQSDLYYSIPGMLNFQMFGIPLVGSDICGFKGDTNEELCSRWMELGAFYPFSRNHNDKGAKSQEPYMWPSVAAISRKVLGIRYSLLPYYYTLFYKANRKVDSGNPPSATVTRPLFFEFPTDKNTISIDRQFMVGSGLLISPVLDMGHTSVSAYFPAGKWYDWYTYLVTSQGNETKTLNTPVDHIQVHVRGGSIIPLQEPGLTTTASRLNDYSLLVALDSGGQAEGDVFLDDGESITISSYTFIEYAASKDKVTATVSGTGYAVSASSPPLNTVTILGVQGTPTGATLNGNPISGFSFNRTTNALNLTNLDVDMGSRFTIAWS